MRDLHRRFRTVVFTVAFTLSLLPAAALLAQEPPVVVALDGSRSLSAAQSLEAAALVRELAARTGATAPFSVLAFDDEVRWLARAGESVDAMLGALKPQGRFTVLHDGLIEGVRALPDGGVLVVVSDGKDENSATTLEDVARLASERGVRIVAIGAGQVDERTMRRLALLTEGAWAGVVRGADPDAIAAEIEALRRQVAAERPAAAPQAAPVEVVAAPPPASVSEPVPATTDLRPLLLVGGLLAAAGIVVGFLLARRRSAVVEPPESVEVDVGTRPGVNTPDAAGSRAPSAPTGPAPEPVDELTAARLRSGQHVPPNSLMEISLDDTASFQRLAFTGTIEHTLVINEEVVLTVREPGRDPRTFRLPPGRVIEVGREAKRNTLAFPDPTMSTQHFRLLLAENEVLLVDAGSTNGVLVHGRRVSSARLAPPDKFRAGMVEFELGLRRASLS